MMLWVRGHVEIGRFRFTIDEFSALTFWLWDRLMNIRFPSESSLSMFGKVTHLQVKSSYSCPRKGLSLHANSVDVFRNMGAEKWF
jgi:hypothetical protein